MAKKPKDKKLLARKKEIPYSLHLEIGKLKRVIKKMVRAEGIEIIMVGESQDSLMSRLMGRDVIDEIKEASGLPVVVVPNDDQRRGVNYRGREPPVPPSPDGKRDLKQ